MHTLNWRSLGAALGTSTVIGLTGCVPSFDADLSRVDEPRLLAVRAEPAEVEAGKQTSLSALVVGGSRERAVDFSLCHARKDLAELGPVAPECLDAKSDALDHFGSGTSILATVDPDACSLFGPRRPDPKPGEPAGRPADPDPTGGYYQPVVARLSKDEAVLGAVRLDCGLTQAEREIVIQYTQSFEPNTNPTLGSLRFKLEGKWQDVAPPEPLGDAGAAPDAGSVAAEPISAGTFSVKRGAAVKLRAGWPDCELVATTPAAPAQEGTAAPETPPALPVTKPCGGTESFLRHQIGAAALDVLQEELIVSWFATDGSFDALRTRETAPDAHRTENTWHAPEAPGETTLWLVVRDGRGGVGWARYEVTVR